MNYTTVCICADRAIYDMGKGEFPPSPPATKSGVNITEPKYKVINAFTCTLEEAEVLKSKYKKK